MTKHSTRQIERAPSKTSNNDTTDSSTKRNTRQEDETTCPECGGEMTRSTTASTDERACVDCGLVDEGSNIDHGPEWRQYDDTPGENPSRTGMPDTPLLEGNMTTEISWQDRDGYGTKLSDSQRKRFARLRKAHKRGRTDSGQRALQKGLTEINRMGSALNASKPSRETAAVIYRKARKEDLIIGRSIEGIASAALYAALRMEEYPRSLDDILKVSRMQSRREIYRGYTVIQRELGLKIDPTSPKQYLSRLRSDLNIPRVYEQEATELIESTDGATLAGRDPTVAAAAALYAASVTHPELPILRQSRIASTADCVPVSLRNQYKTFIAATPRSDVTLSELEDLPEYSGPSAVMGEIHPDADVHRYNADHSWEHIPDELLEPGEN